MSNKKILAALVGLTCLATLPAAYAAPYGFYVGGAYGNLDRNAEQPLYDDLADFIYGEYGFDAMQPSTRFDKKGSGYSFVAGYRLLPNLAFEGGYLDLGEVKYRNTSEGFDLLDQVNGTWSQNIDSSVSGIAVSALGVLPVSYRWELYARAGALFTTNDLDVYIADNVTGSDRLSDSESNVSLLAGVGASFVFAEIYSARLEFQRIFDAGHEITGESDVDFVSLGITVMF
jgi:hypothetical protein